jgi:hypothetical protein
MIYQLYTNSDLLHHDFADDGAALVGWHKGSIAIIEANREDGGALKFTLADDADRFSLFVHPGSDRVFLSETSSSEREYKPEDLARVLRAFAQAAGLTTNWRREIFGPTEMRRLFATGSVKRLVADDGREQIGASLEAPPEDTGIAALSVYSPVPQAFYTVMATGRVQIAAARMTPHAIVMRLLADPTEDPFAAPEETPASTGDETLAEASVA